MALTAMTNIATTLDRRRVYIFPTCYGLMLAVLLVAILLGSINYDNALGYLLSFLLGGLFLIGMLHTYRNLVGLSLRELETTPVFAGEPARFVVGLDNREGQPRYELEVAHAPRRRDRTGAASPTPALRIAAGEIGYAVVVRPSSRRGWLDCGRIRITSVFPLGMLRAWAYFTPATACLVYPAPAGSQPLPYELTPEPSTAPSAATGTDDFAGLRAYSPGDSTRAIDWKTLARSQELLVKRFRGGGRPQLRLRWEMVAAIPGLEARLSQLARWVIEAETAGAQYSLELPHTTVTPGSGRTHAAQCLRQLALYPAA